jgi:hypothetical protein
MNRFSEIVDAASELSLEEQETLLEVLQHRIAECNRARLVSDIADARSEYAAGQARTASVKEIMDEVNGET